MRLKNDDQNETWIGVLIKYSYVKGNFDESLVFYIQYGKSRQSLL